MVKRSEDPMPEHANPMLCTLVREVPELEDYLYEIKWDGYRIIAYLQKGKVRLASRSGLDYTRKYPPIEKALKSLKHDVVIDGEVVVFNEEGKPDFDALQKYNGHGTSISYCVFDLLWMDGKSLKDLPLTERKELLKVLIKDHPVLKFSESFADGKKLYEQVLEQNLEGIVAKQKDSEYIEGSRGNEWLKIPTRKRQEFVIGGWAESENGRSFRSLLFGAYEKGKLHWIGRTLYSVNGTMYFLPGKYKAGPAQIAPNGTATEYYMVFRLAEQYLIRAEAYMHQNKLANAVSDINKIRQRAGIPLLSMESSGDGIMKAIIKERRHELFAEWGHRWLDLKRWGLAGQVLAETKGSGWQSTDSLYPIPGAELRSNPSLTQNEGY